MKSKAEKNPEFLIKCEFINKYKNILCEIFVFFKNSGRNRGNL